MGRDVLITYMLIGVFIDLMAIIAIKSAPASSLTIAKGCRISVVDGYHKSFRQVLAHCSQPVFNPQIHLSPKICRQMDVQCHEVILHFWAAWLSYFDKNILSHCKVDFF